MFAEFHFIRPLWLLLLPLLPLILLGLWRLQSHTVSWQSLIAEELRGYLIDGTSGRLSRGLFASLGFAWLAAVLALAGPAWERLPQPVYQSGDAMVILVDLSPSMQVKDVSPSRLERMRYKLTDLIKARKEGDTALVAYAGDSHVLAPLSDDQQTLLALIPNLSPDIMPIAGSHTEEAVALALDLLQQDQRRQGTLVLLTDGVTEQAAEAIQALFAEQPAGTDFSLSILGIGTREGAPIPGRDGYVKDAAGNIVVARLDADRLAGLANDTGGIYQSLQLDNSDIDALMAASRLNALLDSDELANNTEQLEQRFDQWQEMGSWLLLLVLPVAALAFRRGWLLLILLVPVLPGQELSAEEAAGGYTNSFENLWLTEDQQAAKALQQGDAARAADLFTRPDWQATARYRNGDYAAAAEQFAQQYSEDGNPAGLYNSGNALARSGKLQEALAAYEQVLEQQPEHEDALANKQLVEDLLRQQNPQGQNSQNGQGDESQSSDSEGSESDSADGQDSQGSEDQQGQSSDNQSSDNQSSDNKSSDNKSSASDQQSGSNDQQSAENADSDSGSQNQQQAGGADKSDFEQQSQMQQLQQQLDQQQADALAEQQAEQAAEQQEAEAQQSQEGQSQEATSAARSDTQQAQSPEDAALQKWLGQLPEDAGGLLRNKFNYEYQKKRQAYQKGEWQPAQEQRW